MPARASCSSGCKRDGAAGADLQANADLNPIGYAAWIDDSHFVADDWYGHVSEWAKDPAQPQGPFSLTNSWMLPGQALGIAVALDRQSFVVTGEFGFAVLAP